MSAINFSNRQFVQFADGSTGRYQVYVYQGASMAGDPTAYVIRDARLVWVALYDSHIWIETALQS